MFRKFRRRWSAKTNWFNLSKHSNLKISKLLENFWYWSVKTTVNETATQTKVKQVVKHVYLAH